MKQKSLAGGRSARTIFVCCCPWCTHPVLLPKYIVSTLAAHAPAFQARPDVGGERIPLSEQQFTDLITVHLADWLEQVRPSPRPVTLVTL